MPADNCAENSGYLRLACSEPGCGATAKSERGLSCHWQRAHGDSVPVVPISESDLRYDAAGPPRVGPKGPPQ